MSEYWKSQPRKFCPQCKCWIADNKVSRDFHEGGKKHKEAVAEQLKAARKRGAAVMREQDELAKVLESIEKKAKLAVLKDGVGIDELCGTSELAKMRTEPLEVAEINKIIYTEAEPTEAEETGVAETGLGNWESIQTYDDPTDDTPINPDELPATEDFVVKEKRYEVKTCAVIDSLDIQSATTGPTNFKKRRAKNLRKRTADG